MKKTHLLTQPMRVQDIDFADIDDNFSSSADDRAERSRIRSNRQLRHSDS